MTRRERMERRVERRLDWAESRDKKVTAADARFHAIADGIPWGQPILVGHHSEKHARHDIARIDSALHAAAESSAMAQHHREKADGIEHQLETSIYSDDPDAIEQLQAKLAGLETRRLRMKTINAEIRKGEGWTARLDQPLSDGEKADLKSAAQFNNRVGYPPYALSNLSGNIKRTRDRLTQLTARE
jgi:hypothetical protein